MKGSDLNTVGIWFSALQLRTLKPHRHSLTTSIGLVLWNSKNIIVMKFMNFDYVTSIMVRFVLVA